MKALEIADKQPVETTFRLLDFIKETGGYESESKEDEDEPSSDNNNVKNVANEEADSKKRKASRKLKSLKYVLNSSKQIFHLVNCGFSLSWRGQSLMRSLVFASCYNIYYLLIYSNLIFY